MTAILSLVSVALLEKYERLLLHRVVPSRRRSLRVDHLCPEIFNHFPVSMKGLKVPHEFLRHLIIPLAFVACCPRARFLPPVGQRC